MNNLQEKQVVPMLDIHHLDLVTAQVIYTLWWVLSLSTKEKETMDLHLQKQVSDDMVLIKEQSSNHLHNAIHSYNKW